MVILETPRLYLRYLTDKDATFIFTLLNDPSFIKNIGDRGIKTIDSASQYISKVEESYKKWGWGLFLVEIKNSDTAIGICGLIKRDGLEDVDIGFALLPQFWSQGYALESAKSSLDYAKNKLQLRRLVAITNPDNTPSITLLNKLGMHFEKRIKLSKASPQIDLYAVDF